MVSRRILLAATVVCLLVGALGVALYAQQRIERCAYVPLLAENLLPNADLALPGDNPRLPQGWNGAAPGVELGAFAVDGDGRAMQLLGIANYVQTPPIPVQPGRSYCFSGLAITDSVLGSTTRLQVSFDWQDAAGTSLGEAMTAWQPVVLWQQDAPPANWSSISAAFRAPPAAATLLVRIHPASDDRVYLDAMQLRQGGVPTDAPAPAANASLPTLEPWPNGRRAALAFTFDWETTMAGLIHSRSVGDPNANDDPVQRGLRMREGVTTTLDLFRPHGIRATYYAAGYNFLLGNTARERFMGDPTFAWAKRENRWQSERWTTTPWFADDPYGTVQSQPAWYFGDLVPVLKREQQDIQSHTFSHFYGGLVSPQDWIADLQAWDTVAATQGVPSARSLAFPWSSSGGMSDASWNVLEAAGVRSVTRLSDQAQYNLFPRDAQGLVREPRCRPLPAHPRLLACPDFYLTTESADRAVEQVQRALASGGMIDLWAHTEEVVTPEQIAAWKRVVDFAVAQPDLWIAPLSEIADWQQALAEVSVQAAGGEGVQTGAPLRFTVTNGSERNMGGLTLRLPFDVKRLALNGDEVSPANLPVQNENLLLLALPAGQTVEVQAWP